MTTNSEITLLLNNCTPSDPMIIQTNVSNVSTFSDVP